MTTGRRDQKQPNGLKSWPECTLIRQCLDRTAPGAGDGLHPPTLTLITTCISPVIALAAAVRSHADVSMLDQTEQRSRRSWAANAPLALDAQDDDA